MIPHNSTQENENWVCPSCENTGYCQCDTVKAHQAKVDGLVKGLQDAGNVLGGPTTGYASDAIQLKEQEKMMDKASQIIQEALKRFKEGSHHPTNDGRER